MVETTQTYGGEEMKPKRSMRAAINEKCKDCICDPLDKGTWRQQTEACTSVDCSLFEFRPKSTTSKGNKEQIG